MLHYEGTRNKGGCHVTRVDGEKEETLPLRSELVDHSPDFEWGYGGSGPSQLSLALLADATKDDTKAIALHDAFKWEVISRLPQEGWQLLATDVVETAQALEHKQEQSNALFARTGEEACPAVMLGEVEATTGALDALKAAGMDFLDVLSRHAKADWGDVDDGVCRANKEALHRGGRLRSAYKLPTKAEVWVITNARRSETTLLLSEER